SSALAGCPLGGGVDQRHGYRLTTTEEPKDLSNCFGPISDVRAENSVVLAGEGFVLDPVAYLFRVTMR
ncbi:MAG: hypothetical protein ACO37B_06140, partial [Arenicellales bacterium]